jgi:intracellular septation protein A
VRGYTEGRPLLAWREHLISATPRDDLHSLASAAAPSVGSGWGARIAALGVRTRDGVRFAGRLVRQATNAVSPRAILGVTPILVFALLREVVGTEAAVIGGFAASVIALGLNWQHGRAISGLVLLSVAVITVCTASALIVGDERLFLANDPIVDFIMATVFLGSVALRRPLIGPVAHEVAPRLGPVLDPRHRAFYIATLFVAAMNLLQGGTRFTLLATLDIREYIVFGMATQWSFGLVMVLACAWFIGRAAMARGLRVKDLFSTAAEPARP